MDTTDAEQKAHELLDGRMESVRALVRARQHVTDLEEQLAQARKADHEAHRAALKAGWTTDELKRVGLPELDKNTRRRSTTSNRSRSTTKTTGSTSQNTNESTDEDEAA